MKNEFALFMSNQMVAKDLTLREVSRRSGISTNDLSRIERGKIYPPKGETLKKLAVALELDNSQTDEMNNLSEIVNNKSVDELNDVGKFDAVPTLIHHTGDNDDINDADRQGLMEMVVDENTFKDKGQS